jgi:hypothetical protein
MTQRDKNTSTTHKKNFSASPPLYTTNSKHRATTTIRQQTTSNTALINTKIKKIPGSNSQTSGKP